MEEIKPIAMPGTHQLFYEFFKTKSEPLTQKILDLGAGHGAFSQRLYEMGYDLTACDLFPENFQFDKIVCDKVDITSEFPYQDNTFDIIIAIEVSEHISDHELFFKESSRILKPNGKLFISTPNIVSMKSRMKFLFTGYFYSFELLEVNNHNGLQHVSSLTLDQYNYISVKNNFHPAELDIDRKQNTSRNWLIVIYPFMRFYQKITKTDGFYNQKKLLLGRLLFLTFYNNKQSI
ncbi:MAG: class I SAM-dependent methyltransferase [Bacteroidales bacterium]|nr:class I SAM-dependent methyltransferase [Bacteroidales bacterium]MCF8456294.1 class I SAM-dependent methyltransferase [Bacteroidales bacterium]